VANHLVSRYDVASYFLLKKTNNISTITHCVQDNPNSVSDKENYNPVPSEYFVYWKNYKTANTPQELQRQIWLILDYYFIKLSGWSGESLKERVLVENRESFVEDLPNGTEDCSKLMMATDH
jgi:hypothetical protein